MTMAGSTLDISTEHDYTPDISAFAVMQIETDARESIGEIESLEGASAQVGGYIALYNQLISIANTVAQLAQVAHHAAANTMADAGLKEVVTQHGRALVYGGRTYITKGKEDGRQHGEVEGRERL